MNNQITNLSTLIVGESLTAVKVVFNNNGKEYSYLTAHDLKIDDKAVVIGFNNEYKVVTVTDVISADDLELDPDYEYKFILDKVDSTLHDHIVTARDDLKKGIIREQRKKQIAAVKSQLGLEESVFDTLVNKVKSLIPLTK